MQHVAALLQRRRIELNIHFQGYYGAITGLVTALTRLQVTADILIEESKTVQASGGDETPLGELAIVRLLYSVRYLGTLEWADAGLGSRATAVTCLSLEVLSPEGLKKTPPAALTCWG